MANWARMINSAQRTLSLSDVSSPNWPDIKSMEFDIQGFTLDLGEEQRHFAYVDMVESGLISRGARPLSIWDRLKRRPSLIGELESRGDQRVSMIYWIDPELTLELDLARQEDAELWRECEIMALNGGFHFRFPTELNAIVQQVF